VFLFQKKKEKLQAYKDATDNALSEASEYWNFPEAIPHLCSLYSNLLVSIAERTMGIVPSPEGKSKKGLKKFLSYIWNINRMWGMKSTKANKFRLKTLSIFN
jgi:hypothetical protein